MIEIDPRLRVDLAAGMDAWLRSRRRLGARLGPFDLAQFVCADTATLLTLRNDPAVLAAMGQARPLDPVQHVAWTRRNLLTTPNALLLIVRRSAVPVGFVVLKRCPFPDAAEIGLFFLGERQRSPLPVQTGYFAIQLSHELFSIRWVVTYASPHNSNAVSLNQGIGSIPAPSDKDGELCFRTAAETLRASRLYRWVGKRTPVTVFEMPGPIE